MSKSLLAAIGGATLAVNPVVAQEPHTDATRLLETRNAEFERGIIEVAHDVSAAV